MNILQVDPGRPHDTSRFVQFPFDLYRKTRQWVPPLANSALAALNPAKHPFYQHSEAAFYLAEETGQVVGRIAVMHNRRHNTYRQEKTAFFGYYEVVEDRQVSQALFDAAFSWAKGRGLEEIIGPRGMIGSDGGGILVEGFEHRPALGMPYNPPYYDDFIQEAGFRKDTDHLSGYLPGDWRLPEKLFIVAEKAKKRYGLWVKTFASKEELRQWAHRAVAVHEQAFINNHVYFPPTPEETELVIGDLISMTEPGLIKLVMKGDAVVGFILAYRDISAALQRAGGRLMPFGWYHVLQERRRSEWVNINGVGILPEFRGLGGNALLYTEVDKSVKAYGFKHVEVIQVNEANFASRADMETMGVQWYKRHRSYRRSL